MRYDIVLSIVDIQEENIEKWGSVLSLYQNVRKEGIILWKAALNAKYFVHKIEEYVNLVNELLKRDGIALRFYM